MNHVPHPQEENLGYYFLSGTCLVALETHDLLSFLWSVVCKWLVINVSLPTSNTKYNANGVLFNSIKGNSNHNVKYVLSGRAL